MFNVSIWDKNHDTLSVHKSVQLCPVGVILDYGTDTEILIPFGSGRVHEVFSDTPGAIRLELGQ